MYVFCTVLLVSNIRSEMFCKKKNYWIYYNFQVDIIKTVTIPVMKRFMVDDEGFDLKVLLINNSHFFFVNEMIARGKKHV